MFDLYKFWRVTPGPDSVGTKRDEVLRKGFQNLILAWRNALKFSLTCWEFLELAHSVRRLASKTLTNVSIFSSSLGLIEQSSFSWFRKYFMQYSRRPLHQFNAQDELVNVCGLVPTMIRLSSCYATSISPLKHGDRLRDWGRKEVFSVYKHTKDDFLVRVTRYSRQLFIARKAIKIRKRYIFCGRYIRLVQPPLQSFLRLYRRRFPVASQWNLIVKLMRCRDEVRCSRKNRGTDSVCKDIKQKLTNIS